jgi:hypothetical protein
MVEDCALPLIVGVVFDICVLHRDGVSFLGRMNCIAKAHGTVVALERIFYS